MRAAWAVLAFLIILPLPSPVQATQTGISQWWPPAEQAAVRGNWNLRIPLRLDAGPQAIPANAPVQVHLDLGQSMVRGLWLSSQSSGTLAPKSFTVDPASLRLVQYSGNWAGVLTDAAHPKGELPFSAAQGWFERDQTGSLYQEEQSGAFNPATNALYTLEWRTAAPVAKDHAAYYYLYFDVLQNADVRTAVPAPAQTRDQTEALDGMYWVGTGQRLYGHHPDTSSSQPTVLVIATQDGTSVGISTYAGDYALDDPSVHANAANPFQLQAGQAQRYSLGVSATEFRVDATRPVLVATFDAGTYRQHGSGDFVPSLAGPLRGTDYLVPPLAQRLYVMVPPGQQTTSFCWGPAAAFGQPGATTCGSLDSGAGQVVDLWTRDPAPDPTQLMRVQATAGGQLLLQYVPEPSSPGVLPDTGFQAATVNGGAVGQRFQASTLAYSRSGFRITAGTAPVLASAFQDHGVDGMSPIGANLPIAAGGRSAVSGANLSPSLAASGANPRRFETDPLGIRSIPADEDPAGTGADLQVQGGEVGPEVSQATPFGGRHGMDFMVDGPALAFPYYDVTSLTVTPAGGGAARTLGGGAGTPVDLGLGVGQIAHVVADRPIAILPFGDPGRYSRFLPAQPAFLHPAILPGEYRGYLVDGRLEDGTDRVYFNARPGQTRDVGFVVANLGHRADGSPLDDSVTLSASADLPGWSGQIAFDAPSISLPDDAPVHSALHVTLPASAAHATVTLTVAVTSANNHNMQARFQVVVSSNPVPGVALWFGETGDHTRSTQARPFLEAGGVRDLPIAIQNTGSDPDTYSLAPTVLGDGWRATVLDGSAPLSQIALDPGVARALTLRIEAPGTTTVPAATILLDAVSNANAAAARLLASARLSLGSGVRLDADEVSAAILPGASQAFVVTATNTGNAALSLLFSASRALPAGWNVRFSGIGDPARGTVALPPGTSIPVTVILSAPATARARAVASVLITAEGSADGPPARDAIGLSATALAVHKLTVAAPTDLATDPGKAVSVTLGVRNDGNGPESVTVVPTGVPGSWNVTLPDAASLAPGGNTTLAVTITPPDSQSPGAVAVKLLVDTGQGGGTEVPLRVTVGETRGLVVGALGGPVRAPPGSRVARLFMLHNGGNTPLQLDLAAVAPAAWNASVLPTSLSIAAGENRTALVQWTVPAAAGEQSAQVALAVRGPGVDTQAAVAVTVRRPALSLVGAQALAQGPASHALAFVVASFRNPASVALADAQVRVLEGTRVVDQAAFASIGPNGTVEATLRWAVQDRSAPLTLEWGQQAADGFHSLGSQRLTLAAASAGSPAPSLAVLGALAAALLLRRRGAA